MNGESGAHIQIVVLHAIQERSPASMHVLSREPPMCTQTRNAADQTPK